MVLAGVSAGTAGVASATSITAHPVSFSPAEAVVFSGTVATFTDSNSLATPSQFTATISWGDGSSDTGTITAGRVGFIVSGSHMYADESPETVVVTVQDQAPGTGSSTASQTATVTESDSLTGSAVCSGPTNPGVSVQRTVATFTDANANAFAGDFTATIDWGDGSTSPGTVTGGNGSFSVTGNHTYASAGSFPIKATLSDDAPGTATAQVSTTTGACVTGAAGASISAAEGASANRTVATFTDPTDSSPASAYAATIDWGDGTTSAGTITGSAGSFSVSGTHAYADEGTYAVLTTITATDGSGHSATASTAASIADADVVNAAGASPSPALTTFNGTVATFTDSYAGAQSADFNAVIQWGDGNSASVGTVTGSGGSFTVGGAHTYGAAGTYAITVQILDPGGGERDVTSHYTVVGEPAVQIALPTNGGQLQLGQRVLASYSCKDDANGPGIQSCLGPVATGTPVDTSTPGLHTFTVTAASHDGLTSVRSVTYTVVPINHFTFTAPKVRPNGSFVLSLKLPGPGTVDVLVTAAQGKAAREALILQPARGQFVFARAHQTTRRSGPLRIAVTPNSRGSSLVKHHRHPATLRLLVTYTPTGGTPLTTATYLRLR